MPKRKKDTSATRASSRKKDRIEGNENEISDKGDFSRNEDNESAEETNEDVEIESEEETQTSNNSSMLLRLNMVNGVQTERKEAEVGIVEWVHLKNFMCHGRLDITLGPHVNFIIGRNGSGKSAVVTALIVGLGGKASVTNRGSTVKSFIKSGKQTAEVEVCVRNRGLDAFKPQLYGESIIVQRKFSADGASKYILKSKDGHIVSEKREELNYMLDKFNIQVENPVAILNQDTSRNFLHSKNPNDKYKFFLKATQLEQMKRDYDLANEQKSITKEIISQKERTMPKLKDEVVQWEQKFKNLGALDELKKKVKDLKDEMAWAFVCEKEKCLEPLQKALRVEEARLPKFVQKSDEAKMKCEECAARLKVIQDQLLQVTQEVDKLMPLLKEKRELFSLSKADVRKATNEVNNIERDLRNVVSERKQIQERIRELQKTAQSDYDKERLERQQKIAELEDQLRAVEGRQRTTQHEREQFQGAVSKYKSEIYNISRDEKAKMVDLDHCKHSLHTLSSARSNRLKRFGDWVPNVIAKIEEWHQLGRFHRKPLGPIGACFQLTDPKWSLAVEECLKSLLHSFVCNDHHDEKLLEEILTQYSSNKRRPTIITSKFKDQVHDVSKFRVRDCAYNCLLDIIQCENPVVINTLIDQRGIENVILIPDAPEARNVMLHRPPANCKEAFTLEADHLYCRPTFRNYSSDITSARFLMADVEEEITKYQKQVETLTQEVKALQQRNQTIQKEINTNIREEKKCETQLMKLGETINQLKYELGELKSIEDPVPVDISTLEEDVRSYTQQIADLEHCLEVSHAALREKEEHCKSAEKKFREVETEMKACATSDLPLKEELSSAQMDLDSAKNCRKHYDNKLKEQEKNIADHRKRVVAMQKEIEDDVAKATKICPERKNVRRTAANLESEINQINLRIRQEEKSQGDPDEITRFYNEKLNAYLKLQREVKQFKKFIESLDRVMEHRNEAYVQFQRMIAMRTKYYFIIMLSHRKYLGKMTFSHKNETIDMWVSPEEKTEAGKDLKALSGGERSFSTVCFILSLWNAMESPFRCLDEFDVFMDMVNRRISMDMMLQVARKQKEKQFIFLTPQDMSQLNIGRSCRIFRMPDPDRGPGTQTTLNFN